MSQLGEIFGDASLNLEPKNDDENIYEAFLKTIKETRKTEKEKIEIDGKTVSVTANIYTVKATDAAKLVQDVYKRQRLHRGEMGNNRHARQPCRRSEIRRYGNDCGRAFPC